MSVLISVAGHVYRYVCYIYTFVCMPAGNIFSALLLVGPGGMERWQPCLCQAATSGPIPYQNPFPPRQTGPRTKVEFINAAQAPLRWDWDPRLCPKPFHLCPARVISAVRSVVGSHCKSRCPALRNPVARGSSLEEDTGGEVALYTSPVATGM